MFIGEVIQERRRVANTNNFIDCLRNRLKHEFSAQGAGSGDTSKMQLLWLIAPFSVPAIFYTITNNLGIVIQMEMDPATYQVLGNFKILSTAILFRIIIKKLVYTEIYFH